MEWSDKDFPALLERLRRAAELVSDLKEVNLKEKTDKHKERKEKTKAGKDGNDTTGSAKLSHIIFKTIPEIQKLKASILEFKFGAASKSSRNISLLLTCILELKYG